jgi:predicted transcriptional regulator
MLEELKQMFESDTIKPTFENVHIVLALYIFGDNPDGIGRYRIKEELSIGSGTAKSLIKKLNLKTNFITVVDENKRKGHILTENGLKFLNKIKKKIPILKPGDSSLLNEIIIASENKSTYLCLVKNVAGKLSNGIIQRDAAIKVNGIGATCLVFDGTKFIFKLGSFAETDKDLMGINDVIQTYLKQQIETLLEKDDVVIIGVGDNMKNARLATLNAALTLL